MKINKNKKNLFEVLYQDEAFTKYDFNKRDGLSDILKFNKYFKYLNILFILLLIIGYFILTLNNSLIYIIYIIIFLGVIYNYIKFYFDLDYVYFIFEKLFNNDFKVTSIICLDLKSKTHRVVIEFPNYEIANEFLKILKQTDRSKTNEYFLFEHDISTTKINDIYEINDKIVIYKYVLQSFNCINEELKIIESFKTKREANKVKDFLSNLYKNVIFEVNKIEKDLL